MMTSVLVFLKFRDMEDVETLAKDGLDAVEEAVAVDEVEDAVAVVEEVEVKVAAVRASPSSPGEPNTRQCLTIWLKKCVNAIIDMVLLRGFV